ncbi:pyridoxal phosphate-dependent aminotransferase [Pedobacter panaciterrae]|jgi:Aspartate/tyrosine/aromatic aminotransferase|uniref:pyridoxal phosphate-dependent aminotransferase n=1 Tax=Pedobacter panaciterrae TaxID=363849 RepID=UPI00155D9CA0|nr:aminotransferase class I/II-fold pyridoxal phosphate-dependent enzyme [Pedobacter panaciterrae]NQX55480.1 aminotransferase class I/II-fold pyridoxal phosphate-dependent enzyme [Pedobacter panaciterrae]
MNVSVLANTLIGSEIIKIGNEVNDMKRKGAQIANLTIGDFDPSIFPIPAELKDEIIDAYHHNHTNYPPADGILPLRETVVDILKDRYSLNYAVSDILIAGGSRPLIYATYLALIDPGDKVIYPAPSWNNNHYCHLSSAKGIAVVTTVENNFMPTADQLRPHLKGATLLALCSPLNPTGTMFTQEQLEEICEVVIEENKSRGANEKPLYILYDQIYSLLTFGRTHVNPVSLRPELKGYVIYIDGISKCLSATGVRVGWAFGPEVIISKMKALLGHIGAWAPKAEQVAVAKYFKNNNLVDLFLGSFKEQVQISLDELHNGFQQLKSEGFNVDSVIPMGAIYLTLKIDYIGKTTPSGDLIKNSADVNFYLIKEAQAALVPFSAFGNDESMAWFRASVGGCSLQDIKDMLPRIKAALGKLK